MRLTASTYHRVALPSSGAPAPHSPQGRTRLEVVPRRPLSQATGSIPQCKIITASLVMNRTNRRVAFLCCFVTVSTRHRTQILDLFTIDPPPSVFTPPASEISMSCTHHHPFSPSPLAPPKAHELIQASRFPWSLLILVLVILHHNAPSPYQLVPSAETVFYQTLYSPLAYPTRVCQ